MTTDQIITVVVAIVSAGGASLVTAFFTRRKTNADARLSEAKTAETLVNIATNAARDLIGEYQKRLELVEVELENQARSIENLNSQLMRYRLIIEILLQQIRLLGREPALTDDDIENMPVDALRQVARRLKRDI